MNTVLLKPGKERSVVRGHPWIFQGSVAKGGADSGDTVRVESAEGEFLGWAAYSPRSQIRLRLWSRDPHETIDADFFRRRIAAAIAYRDRLAVPSNGVRLVHGEADGLPGLIVDRYDRLLSVQFMSAGAERWRTEILAALQSLTGLTLAYERSDAGVRQLEGLALRKGWLTEPGASSLELHEHRIRLRVDVAEGHKTGFYLDQRDNRHRFGQWVAQLGAQRVMNCYCYTGGFSVAALAGGAREVWSVDSSGPALAKAQENVALNATHGGFDPSGHRTLDADVNQTLREAIQRGEQFDAIVLDPPKFAPSAAHADRAARAYKDINRLALRLLSPGGLLLTFSCSGGVGPELFHKIVAGAAMDAGVDAAVLDRLSAAPDHPQTLWFPEGEYLKGLAVVKR